MRALRTAHCHRCRARMRGNVAIVSRMTLSEHQVVRRRGGPAPGPRSPARRGEWLASFGSSLATRKLVSTKIIRRSGLVSSSTDALVAPRVSSKASRIRASLPSHVDDRREVSAALWRTSTSTSVACLPLDRFLRPEDAMRIDRLDCDGHQVTSRPILSDPYRHLSCRKAAFLNVSSSQLVTYASPGQDGGVAAFVSPSRVASARAHRMRRAPMITDVLHISSGMNEDGGGTAHLGRLIGASLRRHCARHRLAFRGLHLPPLDGSVATDGYAAFGGSRARLTAAVGRLISPAGLRAPADGALLRPRRPGALARPGAAFAPAALRHPAPRHRDLARSSRATASRCSRTPPSWSRTPPTPPSAPCEYLPAKHQMRIVLLGIEPVVLVGPVDRAVLAGAGEGYALIVGRTAGMDRYKGHDELLEVWPEVRRRLPGGAAGRRRLGQRPRAPARQGRGAGA